MKTLNSVNNLTTSDEILASIEINGSNLASFRRFNFNSIDEVVRSILSMAGNFVGLAKLNIRNKTQGWNMIMGVTSHRSVVKPAMSLGLHSTNHVYGRQLTIPWN